MDYQGALRNTSIEAEKRIRVCIAQHMTSSARSRMPSFMMVAMWARAAVWLTCLAVGQASSVHAAATTTAGDWTPRKPYAESIAFPQVPLFGQSSGSLAGTLFERQSGAQCSSTTGAGYSCPGNSTCCSSLDTPGCCYAGQQCYLDNGVQACCPVNEGYIMCGSTTCVWGFCCEQPGKACAGLSQCCKNGGCCDLYAEECCGDICCTKPSTCCGSICCKSGYVCEAESRCVASATSQAATTVRETVVASGAATPLYRPWQGFGGVVGLIMLELGY